MRKVDYQTVDLAAAASIRELKGSSSEQPTSLTSSVKSTNENDNDERQRLHFQNVVIECVFNILR